MFDKEVSFKKSISRAIQSLGANQRESQSLNGDKDVFKALFSQQVSPSVEDMVETNYKPKKEHATNKIRNI